MNAETFVKRVRGAVVEENFATYQHLFEVTPSNEATDPYWKRALALYGSLSGDQRIVLLDILRQVTVDSVSNLFGILDGSSSLEGSQEDFVLTSGPENLKINGQLQDLFLAAEEDRP